MTGEALVFESRGLRCGARLFLPPGGSRPPPVVVMAHGFAAEQTFRLPAFAERFAAAGLAVLSFDYRNFGASQGEPRNLVDPGRHVEDWTAALAFVRGLRQVDGTRIGLWGSSFSGGHVLVVAAGDGAVRAVVSQVPFVDGLATAAALSLRQSLTGLFHGLVDLAASLFGQVHCVPVVSDPSRFGLMNTPDAKQGYLALVPEGSSWQNRAPARVVLKTAAYRPVAQAARVRCPVLVICAERDALIPARAVRRCATRIPSCRLEALPVGHFDVYLGECFEEVVRMETEFLAGALLGS